MKSFCYLFFMLKVPSTTTFDLTLWWTTKWNSRKSSSLRRNIGDQMSCFSLQTKLSLCRQYPKKKYRRQAQYRLHRQQMTIDLISHFHLEGIIDSLIPLLLPSLIEICFLEQHVLPYNLFKAKLAISAFWPCHPVGAGDRIMSFNCPVQGIVPSFWKLRLIAIGLTNCETWMIWIFEINFHQVKFLLILT